MSCRCVVRFPLSVRVFILKVRQSVSRAVDSGFKTLPILKSGKQRQSVERLFTRFLGILMCAAIFFSTAGLCALSLNFLSTALSNMLNSQCFLSILHYQRLNSRASHLRSSLIPRHVMHALKWHKPLQPYPSETVEKCSALCLQK